MKIAVFRALQLGDLLCAVPAFRALRHAYPDAEITLIGLPWAGEFVRRFSMYLDRLVIFPGYEGLPEQPYVREATEQFISNMKAEQFDLLLQMHGNGTIINELLERIQAKRFAGFKFPPEERPGEESLFPYPETVHEIHRHLLLLESVGIPSRGDALEFPLYSEDREAFRVLNLRYEPGEYVCLHPGSSTPARRWPVKHFAAIGDHFAESGKSVIITGSMKEIMLAAEVQQAMRYEAVSLAGKTTLGSLAILLRNAGGLISNCTGVAHIAAAVKTPSVIISMDGETQRWAPLDKQLHHSIDWTLNPGYPAVLQEAVNAITL